MTADSPTVSLSSSISIPVDCLSATRRPSSHLTVGSLVFQIRARKGRLEEKRSSETLQLPRYGLYDYTVVWVVHIDRCGGAHSAPCLLSSNCRLTYVNMTSQSTWS